MGSFYNNARAVDAIIKSSQAEWKRGYEMGRKKGASLSDHKLLGRNYSAQFRDGHRRGRNELLGIQPEPIKLAEPRNLSPEEIAKEQYDRGHYIGRELGWLQEVLSDKTLSGCHPAFVKGYNKGLADSDDDAHPESDPLDSDFWD